MIVNLRNVSKRFETRDIETSALCNVDLSIDEGEFIAVTGASGCGKSTLLNIIGLLDEPTEGTVEILGTDVSGSSERVRTHHRRSNLAFIFQSFNLIPDLTVRKNVEIGLRYRGVPKRDWGELVDRAIESVGLTHRTDHFPSQLSGGQQQRIAVARAMVCRPAIVLADEPTGNLDPANADEVLFLMRQLVGDGATLIMVTHSAAQAALADRVVVMQNGRIN